jgi:uncharacterized Rmd1/YagE family protein
MEKIIEEAPRYFFQAYHLAETLKLKVIEPKMGMTAVSRTGTKLIFKDGENSFIFVYRFGSLVFFNVEPGRQTAVIEKLKAIVGRSDIVMTSDEYALEVHDDVKNTVHFERVVLDTLTLDRIDLMALVLAQSTALEHFENKVEELLNRSREISGFLKNTGRMRRTARIINKFIGYCMTTKQDLVTSMYLLDKPDETWEDQILHNLHRDAAEMFELKERYRTVDHKLKMIEDNLKIIANLLANKKMAFLEWLIIVLIAVEVVLFVYELWVK